MRTKPWRWRVRFAEWAAISATWSTEQLRQFSPLIEQDVFEVLTLEGSLNARNHIGGTAPSTKCGQPLAGQGRGWAECRRDTHCACNPVWMRLPAGLRAHQSGVRLVDDRIPGGSPPRCLAGRRSASMRCRGTPAVRR